MATRSTCARTADGRSECGEGGHESAKGTATKTRKREAESRHENAKTRKQESKRQKEEFMLRIASALDDATEALMTRIIGICIHRPSRARAWIARECLSSRYLIRARGGRVGIRGRKA